MEYSRLSREIDKELILLYFEGTNVTEEDIDEMPDEEIIDLSVRIQKEIDEEFNINCREKGLR